MKSLTIELHPHFHFHYQLLLHIVLLKFLLIHQLKQLDINYFLNIHHLLGLLTLLSNTQEACQLY